MESAVSERRKAFAAAHRSNEDRQAYITASRLTSSVITKAKAKAWQTTCSSLSPKSNPKTVYSLLRSIAGSHALSSSSPNFPNCSSPRESASVYATYLRSHFSVSQLKTLHSRARSYLSELHRAMCPQESHSSFCSPFSHSELLAAASNLFSSTATGPDKVAYHMLKHLLRSGMDFLLHIFNLSWFSHSIPALWKTSFIIPIHKMRKPLNSPASFRPISFTTCISKLFERIVLSHLLFFLESNSILSSCQAGFCLGRSTLDQILYLSQFISDGFNKHIPGSRTTLSTIDFSKAFDSGILLFSINSFRLASFLLGNDAADELAKRGALLASSAIPCNLSLLISCIHPSLFSDWRHTISSKFLDTQVPLISTEEHELPRHARCVLSHLHCNVHSLLLSSYLSRIGRIKNSSCSTCRHSSQITSHLSLHCQATDSLHRSLFGDSLSLYNLWSRPWRIA